jgi:hypothetical protein
MIMNVLEFKNRLSAAEIELDVDYFRAEGSESLKHELLRFTFENRNGDKLVFTLREYNDSYNFSRMWVFIEMYFKELVSTVKKDKDVEE